MLRIERSSIHDGEGLRTVVFLKGVPSAASGALPRRVSLSRWNGPERTPTAPG